MRYRCPRIGLTKFSHQRSAHDVGWRTAATTCTFDQRGLQATQVDADAIALCGQHELRTPDTPGVSDIGATAPILHSSTQPVLARSQADQPMDSRQNPAQSRAT
jgi:hypothetical protein